MHALSKDEMKKIFAGANVQASGDGCQVSCTATCGDDKQPNCACDSKGVICEGTTGYPSPGGGIRVIASIFRGFSKFETI